MKSAETEDRRAAQVPRRGTARAALRLGALALGVIALVAGGISASGLAYVPDLMPPAGLSGAFVDVMGIRTRYLQRGTGPDILLIHGSPGSIEDWEPQIDALAPGFRVTAYDRPGHGYTDAAGGYSYASNAQFARALVETLGLQRPLVVGHSYGGATALAVALAGPANIRGCVVLDSSVYRWPRAPDPLFRLLAVPTFGTGVARLASVSLVPARIADSLEALFAPRPLPPGFLDARAAIWSQPKVTVTIAHESLLAPAGLAAMSPNYPEIRQPVYIVGQARDPRRREGAERLHREIADSELLLLQDTGHYVQFQQAAEVNAVIAKAARRARD